MQSCCVPLTLVWQLVGPFGTDANPVLVESIYDERIVGCPGHCGDGDTTVNNEIRSEMLLNFFLLLSVWTRGVQYVACIILLTLSLLS